MQNGVRQELDRLFSGIENNPAGFAFWVGIHDYVHFVQSTEQTKQILEDDQKVSMEKCAVIRNVWQSEQAQYDGKSCETGHKVSHADIDRIKKLHSGEIAKIESLSLYYNFLDLEMIYFAINEMANKHSLYTRDFKHKCDEEGQKAWQEEITDGVVKFEKELNEIRKGKISRGNELTMSADTYRNALIFVHRQLLNALPSAQPTPEKKTKPDEPKTGISFDNAKGVLVVNGHKVRIKRQDKINNGHMVLREIFKEPESEHDYAFLFADMTGDEYQDSKSNWKKVYRACIHVNDKVREDSKNVIHDFLDFNTGIQGRVRINPKYLKK